MRKMNNIDKFKPYIWLFACLVILALVWWYFTPRPAPVGSTVVAQKAPELKNVPRQNIAPPKVPVYEPPAKAKLDLPADIQDDPNKYVLGSVKLPNDTHPHTVTTVIDATTGEVQTFDRRDPLPWFKPEQNGEVRIDYGIKSGMAKVARLTFREDLFQVKALHAGIHATLDTDGQYFIGGGVGWRW